MAVPSQPEISRAGTNARALWQWAGLVTVALLGMALRVRLLDIPLERDEGEYAAAAQIILRGGLPYIDVVNMKLPGVFYAYAAILTLFGESIRGIHFALLLMNGVSTLLMGWLARRWFNPAVGLLAAVIFVLLSQSASLLGFTANAEQFVVPPLLAGWLLLTAGGKRPLAAALGAGVLFGIAVLMKQHAFFPAAAAWCWLVAQRFRSVGFGAALRAGMTCGTGIVLPWLATAGGFAAAGAFERFWFWTVTYSRIYASDQSLEGAWANFSHALLSQGAVQWPIWVAAVLGLAGSVTDPRIRGVFGRLLALTIGSVLALLPGLVFRAHYFLMSAPCLALWAAVGISAIARQIADRKRAADETEPSSLEAIPDPPGWLVALLALPVVALSLWLERDYLFVNTPVQIARAVYGGNPFPESLEIARYLREHTAPDEAIAVLGSEPQIYFYAKRRAATTWHYMYPLMELHPFALEMQLDLERQFEAADPKYLVYVPVSTSWLGRAESHREIFRWLDQLFEKRYEIVGVAEVLTSERTVYRWGDDAAEYAPRTGNVVFVYARKAAP